VRADLPDTTTNLVLAGPDFVHSGATHSYSLQCVLSDAGPYPRYVTCRLAVESAPWHATLAGSARRDWVSDERVVIPLELTVSADAIAGMRVIVACGVVNGRLVYARRPIQITDARDARQHRIH
jgi:hypothetical protein